MKRSAWSWALYDFGNSAFATTVMAGFFPIFFKQYWSTDVSVTETTFRLSVASSLGSLMIMLLAPVLGAIADGCGTRKRFLIAFAFLGVLATSSLSLVAQGQWQLALFAFFLASVGFAGSISFYDSLLVFVAQREKLDAISALGYALGYLGGGLLFALNVWMTLSPATFGLADEAEAVKLSFLMVAAWWTLFSVPLLLWVKEPDSHGFGVIAAVRSGLRQLYETFREIRREKAIFLFLIAYWCYIDGVDTIVRMAVDYGLSIGFESSDLITALLITQFVGFPAALVFGRIGEKHGAKSGIYIAIGVYCLVTIGASMMNSVQQFYILALVIGLVQGGIQSLSRSYYATLIPADKSGEFFGFYNMWGKFAAVLGPVMVGFTAHLTGSPGLSLLTLVILFAAGGYLLSRVRQ
jgi:UMF1 family MFS transporter